MAELKNMKFRVSSPEQSKALQEVLFGLGYVWGECGQDVIWTDKPCLFVYGEGAGKFIMYGHDVGYYERHSNEAQDTAAFIAAHTPQVEKTLEDAYTSSSENFFAAARAADEDVAEHPCPWLENHGEMPVSGDVYVDVEYRSGFLEDNRQAIAFDWEVSGNHAYDIVKWRYHRAEDYFKAPKTAPKARLGGLGVKADEIPTELPLGRGYNVFDKEIPVRDAIDTHYNFTYELTDEDKAAGTLRLDPYFVAQQWKLGSKDDSGVIWHIFKTCARFGEKNSKEREITAIYKSIKRLAELEGVVL